MGLINLGPIQLYGFEVPAAVRWGGAQRLAIHRLIGGGRVLDVMGRDDVALEWSGVFSGLLAADRARSLDTMRVGGDTYSLTWNAFCYLVVIEKLRFDFNSPWWIPYEISCVIQRDLAQGESEFLPSLTESLVGDLMAAAACLSGDASAGVLATSAIVMSGQLSGPSLSGPLVTSQAKVKQQILQAGLGLNSSDLQELSTTSGLLAQSCCATGYLSRSIANVNLEDST